MVRAPRVKTDRLDLFYGIPKKPTGLSPTSCDFHKCCVQFYIYFTDYGVPN